MQIINETLYIYAEDQEVCELVSIYSIHKINVLIHLYQIFIIYTNNFAGELYHNLIFCYNALNFI